jgi:hypothetical protein
MRYLLSVILIFSINLKAESPFSEKPEAGEFLEALKYILGSNQNEENNPLNFYEREGLLYKKFTDTPYTGSFEGVVQGQVLKGKASVAQLDRVLASEAKGRVFESPRARQK